MSACERCWLDSGGRAAAYRLLIEARRFINPCTPEQQAGIDAKECPNCKRMTLHQHTGEPMCGCVALGPDKNAFLADEILGKKHYAE